MVLEEPGITGPVLGDLCRVQAVRCAVPNLDGASTDTGRLPRKIILRSPAGAESPERQSQQSTRETVGKQPLPRYPRRRRLRLHARDHAAYCVRSSLSRASTQHPCRPLYRQRHSLAGLITLADGAIISVSANAVLSWASSAAVSRGALLPSQQPGATVGARPPAAVPAPLAYASTPG